jgi:hypothetical protein
MAMTVKFDPTHSSWLLSRDVIGIYMIWIHDEAPASEHYKAFPISCCLRVLFHHGDLLLNNNAYEDSGYSQSSEEQGRFSLSSRTRQSHHHSFIMPYTSVL